MGGAAKHMMQLYDDNNFRINELISFMRLVNNENKSVVFTEKLDGQNLTFSWCPTAHSPRIARGAGDLLSGGMDRSALIKKFNEARLECVRTAYLAAYDVLQTALQDVPDVDEIFCNGDLWFNAEVVSGVGRNVIGYDQNAIVLHLKPVIDDTRFESMLSRLLSILPQMQDAVRHLGWQISPPIEVKLQKLHEKELHTFTSGAQALIDYVQSQDPHVEPTVRNYTFFRLVAELIERGLDRRAASFTAKRILGEKHNDLKWLKKEFSAHANVIDDAVKNEWKMLANAKAPLSKLINDFAAACMKGVGSSLINDNNAEILRLREETRNEITLLQSLNDPAVDRFLQAQLYQLGSSDCIDTSIEGVVFKYGNETYKLTGSFSAANRILGYRRYGR